MTGAFAAVGLALGALTAGAAPAQAAPASAQYDTACNVTYS